MIYVMLWWNLLIEDTVTLSNINMSYVQVVYDM